MIIKKLKEQAEKNPNKIAFTVDNSKIKYKDLYNKVVYYGSLLKKEGCSPVIIYGDKTINSFIAIFSCIYAGRAYVPVGPCTPLDRLKKIKELTTASLVIENDLDFLNKYKDKNDYIFDNNIAYIIFTSGSTGEPKGVSISYDNLYNFIDWLNTLKPMNKYKDVNVLNTASFSFDLSDVDIYYSILNGHTLNSIDVGLNNYELIFKSFKDIDVAVMTPTFMKLCLTNPDFREEKYPSFKCVYMCGEQLQVNLVKKLFNRFPKLNVINAYGPTEATSAVSATLIKKNMLNNNYLPCGDIKTAATNIEIINNEIVLDGKSVFNGYLNGKKINKYHTGDLGYIEDNRLYCIGRKDEQIKFTGYRIEPKDIEINANKIDGVLDALVIVKYDNDDIVKSIKLFVMTSKTSKYIERRLSKLIPGYMMPTSIVVMDKFPINKNGKTDRKAMMNL